MSSFSLFQKASSDTLKDGVIGDLPPALRKMPPWSAGTPSIATLRCPCRESSS